MSEYSETSLLRARREAAPAARSERPLRLQGACVPRRRVSATGWQPEAGEWLSRAAFKYGWTKIL